MCLVLRASLIAKFSLMASLDPWFSPPASVVGMKVLNKEAFKRDIELPAIRLPSKHCSKVMDKLKDVVLKQKMIKKVQDTPNDATGEKKLLLLTPEPLRTGTLTSDIRDWIEQLGGEFTSHTISLDYNHFTMNSILRAVLPSEITDVPSAFECVGHIAHLNLREAHLPYRKLIGQVIIDKHTFISTVVNKSAAIDDSFRFFKMELLAGKDNMVATVKENNCTFRFDFSKVYWNSRLHTEHARVIGELRKGDVVLDMFAGVGPFAVPAAKKGCLLYANDLNPYSYEALCHNAKENKVLENLHAFNLDGRDFVKTVTQELIQKQISSVSSFSIFSHVIMNLPASALEFLDTFQGLFCAIPGDKRYLVNLPIMHCYCFSKSTTPKEDCVSQVEKALGVKLQEVEVFEVRDVSPNKLMMKARFLLPTEVAFYEGSPTGESSAKRPRLDIDDDKARISDL